MRLSIVPSIRSRRVVSDGGLHLSVAHDLTCFMTFFELDKLCLNEMPKVSKMHYTFDNFMNKYGKRFMHSRIQDSGPKKS